jgi:hypothetical protein
MYQVTSQAITVAILVAAVTGFRSEIRGLKWLREAAMSREAIEWKNDVIFPASGAYPYRNALKNVDFNLLDTGHFALEEQSEEIAFATEIL